MYSLNHVDCSPLSKMAIFFFFSSRRRHTRFDCDWSSDVCSSDLGRGMEPIGARQWPLASICAILPSPAHSARGCQDRKSTRLNSSHSQISYAVFCLKKKKKKPRTHKEITQLYRRSTKQATHKLPP